MKEFRTDAIIHSDAAAHVLHIRANFLAQICHFVDESDLGGKECIRRIFDEFARAAPREKDRRFIEEQGAVDFTHDFAPEIFFSTNHDTVGAFEIANCRTLAQEFRIGNYCDAMRCPAVLKDPLNLVPSADGYGGFGHDHGVARQMLANLLGHSVDEGKVRMTIAAPTRSADSDENGVGALDPFGQTRSECQAACLRVRRYQIGETRLINRHDTVIQTIDLRLVLVDANHVVTEIGKTCS